MMIYSWASLQTSADLDSVSLVFLLFFTDSSSIWCCWETAVTADPELASVLLQTNFKDAMFRLKVLRWRLKYLWIPRVEAGLDRDGGKAAVYQQSVSNTALVWINVVHSCRDQREREESSVSEVWVCGTNQPHLNKHWYISVLFAKVNSLRSKVNFI